MGLGIVQQKRDRVVEPEDWMWKSWFRIGLMRMASEREPIMIKAGWLLYRFLVLLYNSPLSDHVITFQIEVPLPSHQS